MNVWGWFLIILGFSFVVGQLIAILGRNRRAQTPGQFVTCPPPVYRPLQYEIDGKAYSPVQAEAVWAAIGRYPWAGEFLERVRTEQRWPDEFMEELQTIQTRAEAVRKEHGGGPARNWKYKLWIRSLPCAICGLEPCGEAAHTGGDGGMAMKASDYSCIPLCPACHTFGPESYHVLGRGAWEARHAIDAAELVRRLASLWFRERARRQA